MTSPITTSAFKPGVFRLFLAGVVVVHHTTRLNLGTWAVFVFFVLSGYWIGCMWDTKYRDAKNPLRTFLVSRYWRLAPTLFLCVGIYYAAMFLFDSGRWDALANSLAQPDWIARSLAILSSSSQQTYLGPKWSIDIELQFYIAACFVLTLFSGKVATKVVLSAISVICFILFFELQGSYDYPAGLFVPYAATFFVGTLAYYLRWVPSRRLAVGSLVCVGLFVALTMLHDDYRYVLIGGPNVKAEFHHYNEVVSYILALIAAPFALYTVKQASPKIDRHIGNLAYPVYLFHMTPILIYRSISTGQSVTMRLSMFALTYLAILVGGLAIYWFFDKPIDQYRSAYVKRRVA